ncbi:MAG: hypothetical protein ABSH41_03755 [Syntrophobacteraceae bacterium]|jgi:hypothetical protein
MQLPIIKAIVDVWASALKTHHLFEQRKGSVQKCDRAKANLGRLENAVKKRRAHNRMAAESRRAQQRRAA